MIRNFRFYRTEEEPEPIRNAVYRAGDAIWSRFDIIGYKFGEGNLVEVSYGVAVLNADGKVLFAQDQAAVEQGGSFIRSGMCPGR